MERERRIRARVERAFCSPRDTFASQDAWNDYLEQREDIAFNLVEGIDVAKTEERLRQVEQENAVAIAANQAKEVRRSHTRVSVPTALPPEAPSPFSPQCAPQPASPSSPSSSLAQVVVDMDDEAADGAGAMQIGEDAPPSAQKPGAAGNTLGWSDPPAGGDAEVQRQKHLALLASGWSMEIVRNRAIQTAYDTFVLPPF